MNGYEFNFGSFLANHLMPGLLYPPFKRSAIRLSEGPAVNLYPQNIRVGAGADLHAGYCLTVKISVGPAIYVRKFSNMAAL